MQAHMGKDRKKNKFHISLGHLKSVCCCYNFTLEMAQTAASVLLASS